MTSDRPVRTRYAPSPTGLLHIGGVRTALYSWLYARHFGGQFLLRIEDTDLERSEDRYTQDIYSSMNWLGLGWDEEPIYQSKRMPVYLERAEWLVAQGHAYWCDCTEADVDKMREEQTAKGLKPMYDRRCRDRGLSKPSEGKTAVVRVKIPLDGATEFTDLIRGPIRVENTEVDDFVIIRSNGSPTYNLSCVVDDVEQRMSHVIRGDDHINNTPKQIHLYQYFGYEQPHFAHLPMVLGPDKKKLSKRNGIVSANSYRADGYLPEAMLNFLARLGWSHGDQEVFSIDEMVQFFGFDHVQKASGVFNPEKLLWLNGEHLRKAEPARLAQIILEDFSGLLREPARIDRVDTRVGHELIVLIQAKTKLVKEIAQQLPALLMAGSLEVDPATVKWGKKGDLKAAIQSGARELQGVLRRSIASCGDFSRTGVDAAWGSSPALQDAGMGHQEIDAALRQICETHGLKLGEFMQPLRMCIAGASVSAGVFDLLAVLPWDVVEPRLEKVLSL